MNVDAPAAQTHANGAVGTNGTTDTVTKRKATTPTEDEAPKEKRARTVPPDERMQVDGDAPVAERMCVRVTLSHAYLKLAMFSKTN